MVLLEERQSILGRAVPNAGSGRKDGRFPAQASLHRAAPLQGLRGLRGGMELKMEPTGPQAHRPTGFVFTQVIKENDFTVAAKARR